VARVEILQGVARLGFSAALACTAALSACSAQGDPADRFLDGSVSGPALRELRDSFPEEWSRVREILLASSTAEQRSTATVDEFERFIQAHRAQVRVAPNDMLVALVSARQDLIHAQAEAAPLACASAMTDHAAWQGSASSDFWILQYNFYRLTLIAIERGAATPTHHNLPDEQHFERLRQVLVSQHVAQPIIDVIVQHRSADTLPTEQRCPAAAAFLDGLAALPPEDQADFEGFSGP
jgi:hypothetical protein